jgi:hypothetical protein
MAGNYFVRIGLFGALTLMLAPAAGSANQLNITTMTPVRPQIYLNPSLHMDVRSRTVYDLDLSSDCRPDERLKKSKRERRCRQDR